MQFGGQANPPPTCGNAATESAMVIALRRACLCCIAQTSASSGAPTSVGASSTSAKLGKLCCDKCDGKHETAACPYFKKARDKHPDAAPSSSKKYLGVHAVSSHPLQRACRILLRGLPHGHRVPSRCSE